MLSIKLFLGVQLMATAATAITLMLAPAVIPAHFGVALSQPGFMLAYLLAAAELTCAICSAVAIAARDVRIVVAVASGSALYQFLFGLAGLYGTIHDNVPRMLPNVIVHAVIVAMFVVLVSRLRRAASPDGRSFPA